MNVITIVCDTLRRDHCNPYTGGAPKPLNQCWNPDQPEWSVPTPNMQKLAERGTTFTNCWNGSTPCMPARRDIYTGRYEFLERGWGPMEEWDADLPSQVSNAPRFQHTMGLQQLKERGGRISQLITDHVCLWSRGSGNYHMGYSGFEFIRGHQWDNWKTEPVALDTLGALGVLPEADRATSEGWADRHALNNAAIRLERGERGWLAHQVFEAASDWLDRNHSHEDFYLHIDCFDPHEPWDPPRELVQQFMPEAFEVPGAEMHPPYTDWRQAGKSPEWLRSHQARYAAMCVLVDRALGRLIEAMDRLDLWKSTLLVFTTDHGTWNGERGRIGKLGTHQHDGDAHIPFIVCHPTLGHGQTRDQPVQLVDIYPTSLSAVGRPLPEQPENRPLHGVDLLPVLADASAPTRDYALCGQFGDSVTITDGRWILHQSPVPENRPLYWYGHCSSDFVSRGPLGPIVDGRREVLQTGSASGPTWLSDKASDPSEYENLAESHPAELQRMQAALKQKLIDVKAPPEQLQRLGLA